MVFIHHEGIFFIKERTKDMKRAFLFLDIDGVMNPLDGTMDDRTVMVKSSEILQFPDHILRNLELISEQTGCYIILSSTWKLDYYKKENVKIELGRCGMVIYDQTPSVVIENKRVRGMEINSFLKNYASKHNIDIGDIAYVILDDEVSDIVPYHTYRNIVQCNMKTGLTESDTHEAISKLNLLKELKGY